MINDFYTNSCSTIYWIIWCLLRQHLGITNITNTAHSYIDLSSIVDFTRPPLWLIQQLIQKVMKLSAELWFFLAPEMSLSLTMELKKCSTSKALGIFKGCLLLISTATKYWRYCVKFYTPLSIFLVVKLFVGDDYS